MPAQSEQRQHLEPEPQNDPPVHRDIPSPEVIANALQIDSVSKHFGTSPVLNSVSLTLRQREVLALCGASGCGKTTLIRIICGLIHFDSGHLRIGSTSVPPQTPYPKELYGKVGVIFQDHNLFPHMTAIGNVTLALREFKRLSAKEAQERGMAELKRMGVDSIAQRYPASLSGGERQRIAIARALAMDPLLLLLDEPTANLDPDRVDEVCDRVLELASSGTTMLLVTHNLECARQAADTFALLQDGICLSSDDPAILEGIRCRLK
jgi:ABC-type polar amino acid transport system ATPase subunit